MKVLVKKRTSPRLWLEEVPDPRPAPDEVTARRAR